MRRYLLVAGWLIVSGCQQEAQTPPQVDSSTPAATPTVASEKTAPAATVDQPVPAAAETADNSPAVQQLLARASKLSRGGATAAAIELLSRAIGLDSECATAWQQRARMYVRLGQHANASADFSMAVRLDPENAEIRNSRGFYLFGQNQLEQALEDFDKAIALRPEYREPWNNRGLVQVSRGELEAGVADFSEALKIAPDYHHAWNNRGYALMRLGRNDEALSDFNKAIELVPEYEHPWHNRGLLHFGKEDYRLAVVDFTEAIARSPGNVKYYLHRRASYAKMGRDIEAEADGRKIVWLQELGRLNQQVAMHPRDPDAYIQRAAHWHAGGEVDSSVQDYGRALKLQPECVPAFVGRAGCWLEQDNIGAAIDDCNAALRIRSSHEAFSLRGDAHLKMGDFEQAITDYREAKRIDSNVVEAYLLHAAELERSGETDEARKARERALALDPAADTVRQ